MSKMAAPLIENDFGNVLPFIKPVLSAVSLAIVVIAALYTYFKSGAA